MGSDNLTQPGMSLLAVGGALDDLWRSLPAKPFCVELGGREAPGELCHEQRRAWQGRAEHSGCCWCRRALPVAMMCVSAGSCAGLCATSFLQRC